MSDMTNYPEIQLEHLTEALKYNFQLIQTKYRTGLFESNIQTVDYISTDDFSAWIEKLITNESRTFILFKVDKNFLESKNNQNESETTSNLKTITFKTAVKLLYQQTKNLMDLSDKSNSILVLDVKILIYECLEYFSKVPEDLGEEFIGYTRQMYQTLRASRTYTTEAITKYAISTCGLPDDVDEKQIAKALKTLLLVSLGGVSHLFHYHTPEAYKEGLQCVSEIHRFILYGFGQFKRNNRPSLGLSGLAYFLTGLLQRARGGDNLLKAENSFINSLNAYSRRVIQKEYFFEKGWITEDKYLQQRSVSLRRTALVSTLGLSYLFLITGKLSRAEMALILPRAVLRQNSGRIYSTYADMMFWAIQRAKHSDKKETIKRVINGLNKCLKDFQAVAPASNYEHRCNLELALAHRYAADFEDEAKEAKNYETAEDYATKAIDFALGEDYKEPYNPRLSEPHNPHLLAEALFIRSHLRRSKPDPNLIGALGDADNALKLVPTKLSNNYTESINVASDVLIANAAIRTTIAEQKRKEKQPGFEDNFNKAYKFLLEALEINNNTNLRINAVCYLRLTRLFLIKENELSRALYYFGKWKEIAPSIEHAFCQVFANSLERKMLFPTENLLIIDTEKSLNYEDWCKTLLEHLLNKAVEIAKKEIYEANIDRKKAKSILARIIYEEVKGGTGSKDHAYTLIYNHKLEERLDL